MEEQFDLVVIGAGPGGYMAALRAAQLGLKTAIIEKSPTLGGTCLNVGCIPSKALLQATELLHQLKKQGPEWGFKGDPPAIDFQQLMAKKAKVVEGLVNGVKGLIDKRHIRRFQGIGRLKGLREVLVEQEGKQEILRARNILIATGSEPIPLPFLPFDEKRVLSSTGALSLSSLPKKMGIIGGGVIGVELASVYSRLGTEVTVIEMLDQICPLIDPSLSKMLLQTLKKQGIQFHLSSRLTAAKTESEGVLLEWETGGKKSEMRMDVVLVAVGRRPYTKGLQLEAVGIKVDAKGGIPVDDGYRTSVPHIYAIGDVIEGPQLAHRGFDEGSAVAESLVGQVSKVNIAAIPTVIYTSPEVATVGMTEEEAHQAGVKTIVGSFPFRGNPRARCAGEEEGVVKIIGEAASKRLLGLHIMGPYASELIQEGAVALHLGATIEEIAGSSHAHPTYSEAIKEAALDALGKVLHI